jgi:two-component system chemotaxis response regulator CheY
MYEQILPIYGYKIIGIAVNGKQAVEMFDAFSEKPKIIIMDHRMPVKNGIEATKEILEKKNDVRIIFASADSSIKAEAEALGIAGFLVKPFRIENLVELIQKILSEY